MESRRIIAVMFGFRGRNLKKALRCDSGAAQRWGAICQLSRTVPRKRLRTLLLEHRTVALLDHLDDAEATRLISELLYLEDSDRTQPISVFLHSRGGVVTAAAGVVDTFEQIHCPVHTIVPAWVSGVATWIAAAGAPGHRAASTRATVQMNPLNAKPSGPAHQSIVDTELKRLQDLLEPSLTRHTGRTREAVRAMLRRRHTFTAEEARAWGIVDRVY